MLESYIFRAPGQHGRDLVVQVVCGWLNLPYLRLAVIKFGGRGPLEGGCEEETLSHNWIWLPASSNLATRRGEGQLLHEAGHAVYSMCDNVQQLHMNIEGQ